MFNIVFRALMFYILLLAVMRIMGKREVGQLQPFELIVMILISELAANTVYDIEQPTLPAIITVLVLVFAQTSLSLLMLKSEKLRTWVSGKPSILIEDGVIQEEELRRQHYSLDDLLEELRANGYFSIQEVSCAVLETSGRISAQPSATSRPLQPKDMNLPGDAPGMPYVLVMDGSIQEESLTKLHVDRNWLTKQLKRGGFEDPTQVLLAILDETAALFIQAKGEKGKKPKIWNGVLEGGLPQ